ncbi:OLC1v1018817C2 [Oldenlandia corymbosa var. corymbosa]|nr:OLC1v1018817C2 [Oldenlandia corymbosa var. corymbosa]
MGSRNDRNHKKKGVNLGPKRSSFQKKKTELVKKKNKNSKKKKGVNGKKDEIRVRNDEKNYENGVEMVEEKSGGKVAKRRKSSKNEDLVPFPTASQQLNYFLNQYQSGNGIQLSALELEAYKDEYMLELKEKKSQTSLAVQMKSAFGSSYQEVLCHKQIAEGKIDPGNPALLVISSSALRSLELFREFRPLTKECPAVKLFSKHMKIEEQVSLLKNRVNIACGTPNR